jgi:hypothetical protein
MSEAKPRLMTCDEFDALLDLGDPLSRSEAARQHAVVCPRCRALAGALSEARSGALPASALAKAEAAAALNLTPVRSLRSPLIAAAGTLTALACLLVAGVLVFGTRGWAARLPWQRAASYLGGVARTRTGAESGGAVQVRGGGARDNAVGRAFRAV